MYILTENVYDKNNVLVVSNDAQVSKENIYNQMSKTNSVKSDDISVDRTITKEFKKMTITSVYDKNFGVIGKFSVKIELEYLKSPKERHIDIIGITNDENVQIMQEFVNNDWVPSFNSYFTYDRYYLNRQVTPEMGEIIKTESTKHTIQKLNTNKDDYAYDNDNEIAVRYELPENIDFNDEYPDEKIEIEYKEIYSNFKFVIEANYIPKSTDLNATMFAGTFKHQLSSKSIKLTDITFSSEEPYITFSIEIEKKFEEPFVGKIFFQDIAYSVKKISPIDYGFLGQYFFYEKIESHDIRTLLFETKRLRTGFIENKYLVLSSNRVNAGNAYLEYNFYMNITAIKFEASLWSEIENINDSNSSFKLQYKNSNGDWIDVKDFDLSRLSKSKYKMDEFYLSLKPFSKDIKDIRFYLETSDPSGTRNKGRVVIGDVTVYYE